MSIVARPRRWNIDKKHRCPGCHAIAISDEPPRSWLVYDCHHCGIRFTRWPRLAAVLPKAGIRCECRTKEARR